MKNPNRMLHVEVIGEPAREHACAVDVEAQAASDRAVQGLVKAAWCLLEHQLPNNRSPEVLDFVDALEEADKHHPVEKPKVLDKQG